MTWSFAFCNAVVVKVTQQKHSDMLFYSLNNYDNYCDEMLFASWIFYYWCPILDIFKFPTDKEHFHVLG